MDKLKRFLVLGLVLVAGTLGGAAFQIQRPASIINFMGAPSGTCTEATLANNTSNGDFYNCDGGTWHLVSGGSGSGVVYPCTSNFRLSATTGVFITTSDVATTSTLYWVPGKGNHASFYSGGEWVDWSGSQLSLALSSLTSGANYDVFIDYTAGSPVIELVIWTNDTTRATALSSQDNCPVQDSDSDSIYVGTIRTIATNATADYGGGTSSQVGAQRFIWNYYNRARRTMAVFDGTNTWDYSTQTWRQANADAGGGGNKFEFVVGIAENAISANLMAIGQTTGTSPNGLSAMGLDSTSSPTSLQKASGQTQTSGGVQLGRAVTYDFIPTAGYHYLAWLESGNNNSTMTWFGDANAPTLLQSAMTGEIWN